MWTKVIVVVGVVAMLGPGASASPEAPGAVEDLTKVSGSSPFQPGGSHECSLDDADRDLESESSIAVDPNDANRVAVAWQQDNSLGIVVGSSSDGGQTWSRTVVEGLTTCTGSPNMNRVSHPRLSFAPDGRLYLAAMPVSEWGPDPRNIVTDITVASSEDGGVTWSSPSSITTSDALNDFDGMTIEMDTGAVDVVWSENEAVDSATVGEPIYLSRSTDRGETWIKRLVRRAAPGSIPFTKVASLPTGQLVLFSQEIPIPAFGSPAGPHGPIWVLTSNTKGASWSAPVKMVDDAVNEWPSIAVTRKGALFLAYRTRSIDGGFSLWLTRSDDGGTTWTEATEAFSYPYSHGAYPFISLAVTGEQTVGVLHYASGSDGAGHQARLAISPDCGQTWSSTPVGGAFTDIEDADLGFTQGLAPVQNGFLASVSLGGEEGTVGRTDMFAASIDWRGAARASSCSPAAP